METNSLPIELDPYHFNTYDGKNSFCLHTRENKPCFWNSCQDIQTKTPLVKPDVDSVRIIDLKLTQGYKKSNLSVDTLQYIKDFLNNEQFLKTLHVQNWSWKKERESIFNMEDFIILINFMNKYDFSEHNIKLEIVNKENYILEKYGKENAEIHFLNNLPRYLKMIKKINYKNFIKIDFFHYFSSDDYSCWIKIKLNDTEYSDNMTYYNPTYKSII